LFADGLVLFLDEATPPRTVRAMLARAGNEEVVIDPDR
jgi:hypothetical protein